MSVNSRLLHRLCHSHLFSVNASSSVAVSLRSKHCITTKCTPWSANAQLTPHQNILFAKQWKCSFATKSNVDDKDDDTDSDFSDLSDFSDSDDDEEAGNRTSKKRGATSTPSKHSHSNANANFKFGHDRDNPVSDDMLMKDRLIISNLNFSTNRNDLWELCENYGTVTDVHLPPNRNRDFQNRGFGFVTFETDQHAAHAMDNIAGTMFNSRQLRVGLARRDTEKGGAAATGTGNSDFVPFTEKKQWSESPRKSDFATTAVDMSSQAKFAEVGAVAMHATASSSSSNQNVAPAHAQSMETTMTVSGLPGNINLSQITKMFAEFGHITNITFSPYRMMGHSFMNALVTVDLSSNTTTTTTSAAAAAATPLPAQSMNGVNGASNETGKESVSAASLSFQNEADIKDRSVEKTPRQQQQQQQQQQPQLARRAGGMHKAQTSSTPAAPHNRMGGIDPDVLAKEIDELLADTDDEEDSEEENDDKDAIEVLDELDDSDSDSTSTSTSDDDDDSDDVEEEDSDDDEEEEEEDETIHKNKNKNTTNKKSQSKK